MGKGLQDSETGLLAAITFPRSLLCWGGSLDAVRVERFDLPKRVTPGLLAEGPEENRTRREDGHG